MGEQSDEYICRFCGWKGTNTSSAIKKTDAMHEFNGGENKIYSAQSDTEVYEGEKCPKCDCEVEMLNIITIVKEVMRTWRKINHIRTRSYVLISLSTLALLFFISQIFIGIEVKYFWFELELFNSSYLNMGLNYCATIICIYGAWVTVFSICRTFLNIFAFTTKDTINAKFLTHYQQIIDHYVGELTPRTKADLLLEHSTKKMIDTQWYNPTRFRTSKQEGYDVPHLELENNLYQNLVTIYILIFSSICVYYYFEPVNAMKLFDIYLFYWIAIGACLSATVSHILVSFIDVESSIQNNLAEELAEEYVKLQNQSVSDSSSESE